MQQNTFKADKKAKWAVSVTIEMEGYDGRVFSRKLPSHRVKKLNDFVVTQREYLYLNVTKMYKKNNTLHIHIGKLEHHMHEVQRVLCVQVREYKRGGVQ